MWYHHLPHRFSCYFIVHLRENNSNVAVGNFYLESLESRRMLDNGGARGVHGISEVLDKTVKKKVSSIRES